MKCSGYVAMVAVLLFTGCAAGGERFSSVEAAPEDKALIYFYRPNNFQGSAVDITIKDNGVAAAKIQNGQYIKYIADVGAHRLHTDTMAIDKPTDLEAEAGKTYFYKTVLNVGMWTGTWSLNRVYDAEALEEMRACCKSGKK